MAIIGSSSNLFHTFAIAGSSNASTEANREETPSSATRPTEQILADIKKFGGELANLYQQHGAPNQRGNARAPDEAELRRSVLHVHAMRSRRTATVSFKDQQSGRTVIWSLNRHSEALDEIENKAGQYDKLRNELRAAQSLAPAYKQHTPSGEEMQQRRAGGNKSPQWLREVQVEKPKLTLEDMPQELLKPIVDNLDAAGVMNLIGTSRKIREKAMYDANARLKVLEVESALRQMGGLESDIQRMDLFHQVIFYIKNQDVPLVGSNRLYVVTLLVEACPFLRTNFDKSFAFKSIGEITEGIIDNNLRGQGIECMASHISYLVGYTQTSIHFPNGPGFIEERRGVAQRVVAADHFSHLTELTANISNEVAKTRACLSLVNQLDTVNTRTGRVERFVKLANIFGSLGDAKLIVQGICALSEKFYVVQKEYLQWGENRATVTENREAAKIALKTVLDIVKNKIKDDALVVEVIQHMAPNLQQLETKFLAEDDASQDEEDEQIRRNSENQVEALDELINLAVNFHRDEDKTAVGIALTGTFEDQFGHTPIFLPCFNKVAELFASIENDNFKAEGVKALGQQFSYWIRDESASADDDMDIDEVAEFPSLEKETLTNIFLRVVETIGENAIRAQAIEGLPQELRELAAERNL